MQYSLKGKTAVITGAGRGLGLAFAQALASANCNIAVLDVLSEPSSDLYDLRSKFDVKVEYYRIDVTSRDQVFKAIDTIESEFGSVNININAAGIAVDEPFLISSEENIAKQFAVNFNGSLFVAQACGNSMKKRWEAEHGSNPPTRIDPTTGSIVFIGSIATHVGTAVQQISVYTATKAAVRGLVKPMAMELAQYGIRVNSLSPGYMFTDMMRSLQKQQPKLVAQFEHETMFGRVGFPEELKGAILFMCSDAGRWYTGQDLLVDGGASSWKHPADL